ncbi:acyl carrier protein 1, mitochondrial-like [Elaeis guineensis]|uniref:NADH-ubiquinone oxidoreductase 9.6 kDa subunit n=1 Tax=Elaeis guineensis var. tenera TaxID=51953 RepID=A0A6I9R7Q0_ELAGV|nr:acyl carrier protein 1, mitochondrial-like [Elaeis guineensis]
MVVALRPMVLCHIRIPIQTVSRSRPLTCLNPLSTSMIQSMSSHGDDHLTKEEVIKWVLGMVKSFPKIDHSKVILDVHFQKDLGLDSLDNVEIVMASEEFKLKIRDKEADKIDSHSLTIKYVSTYYPT